MDEAMVRCRLLFIILLAVAAPALAADLPAPPVAATQWEILDEDPGSLDAAQLRIDWKPLSVPATFKLPHADDETFRYLWLRARFPVDGDPAAYYGIHLGRVAIADTTWLNRAPVGSRSILRVGWIPLPRGYVIPPGLLKRGSNELYLRLGVFVHNYGGLMDQVTLRSETDFDQGLFASNFFLLQIPIAIALLYTVIAIALLLAYVMVIREKIILLNAIALAILVLFIASTFLPFGIVGPDRSLALQASLVPVLFMMVILMFQAAYRIYLTEYNRVIFPLFIVIALASLLWHSTIIHLPVGRITTLLNIIIFAAVFPFMIRRLNRLHPDRFRLAMVVLFSIITVLITAFEMVSEFAGWRISDLIAIYSTPVYIPLFAVMYGRELVAHRIALDSLYARLAAREGRTRELTITGTAEEKLNRLIDFLKEHYHSDISREGLAAAVDMNPNYMGSLFRTYTGRRINEYIADLRIAEAKRRLAQGDEKIIDIALSVGFESLATFNRVFKQTAGTTPSAFRNSQKMSSSPSQMEE